MIDAPIVKLNKKDYEFYKAKGEIVKQMYYDYEVLMMEVVGIGWCRIRIVHDK